MQRSGTRPVAGVADADLVGLVGLPGPFLSAYLPIDRAVDDAPQRNALRWRALREQVEGDAPEAALDAVGAVVHERRLDAAAIAVVCHGDDVVLEEPVDEVVPPDGLITCGPLPRLAPLVASRQRLVPYVLAVVDKRGAELTAVTGRGLDLETEVTHEDPRPERKVKPGGWSQRRYQQRAEDRWDDSAKAVAEEVASVADRVGARLIVLAGDEPNVARLQAALPARLQDLVATSTAGRGEGAEGTLEDDLRRLVHDVAARDVVATLEKLREERGQADRAVEGPGETLRAFQRAQVDLLLVHDSHDDDRRAWFGSEPTTVAVTKSDLTDLGYADLRDGRLVDVAIRAALLTGAAVQIVPKGGGPAESIGALLRWA